MTLEEIESKTQNAKALDFGDIFNKSIELFKKSWLYGLLFQLFIMVIMTPFIIIFYVPFIMAILAQAESGQTDPDVFDGVFAGLTGIYMVFFVVAILAVAVIQLAVQAGFFRILKEIDHGREVKITDLFYFLKGKYFSSVTLLMLAAVLVSLITAVLCFVPLIYAIIPMSYFVIVFAFNPEMSIVDIVKVSFKLGTKKWLLSFGLFLVVYLIVMALIIFSCGLGSLFLTPFIYLPFYFIYKEVIGFGNNIGSLDH